MKYNFLSNIDNKWLQMNCKLDNKLSIIENNEIELYENKILEIIYEQNPEYLCTHRKHNVCMKMAE